MGLKSAGLYAGEISGGHVDMCKACSHRQLSTNFHDFKCDWDWPGPHKTVLQPPASAHQVVRSQTFHLCPSTPTKLAEICASSCLNYTWEAQLFFERYAFIISSSFRLVQSAFHNVLKKKELASSQRRTIRGLQAKPSTAFGLYSVIAINVWGLISVPDSLRPLIRIIRSTYLCISRIWVSGLRRQSCRWSS